MRRVTFEADSGLTIMVDEWKAPRSKRVHHRAVVVPVFGEPYECTLEELEKAVLKANAHREERLCEPSN